jgi:Tfp pilus assembly protein PilN
MAAEDIRNLQPWTLQQRRASGRRLGPSLFVRLLLGLVLDLVLLGLQRREAIKRAHDLADRVGCDVAGFSMVVVAR